MNTLNFIDVRGRERAWTSERSSVTKGVDEILFMIDNLNIVTMLFLFGPEAQKTRGTRKIGIGITFESFLLLFQI